MFETFQVFLLVVTFTTLDGLDSGVKFNHKMQRYFCNSVLLLLILQTKSMLTYQSLIFYVGSQKAMKANVDRASRNGECQLIWGLSLRRLSRDICKMIQEAPILRKSSPSECRKPASARIPNPPSPPSFSRLSISWSSFPLCSLTRAKEQDSHNDKPHPF